MKIRKFLVLVALVLVSGTIFQVAAQSEDKITQAVMKVYDDYIAKNPNDYNTLFMRANQLYFNGNYEAAMNDVDRTIQLAPAKETELLFDAYMLRSKLFELKRNYDAAIADVDKAATIDPTSLACVDMKGKLAYAKGDYNTAEVQFKTILQHLPRNFDAMYCLGRIEADKGNTEEAMKWVDQAMGLFPTEPQVYLNRAHVQEQLGKYRDACDTYLIAMSSTDDKGESISHIVELADSHYDDVIASLRGAIKENPNVGIFYRLSSAIALKYNHYGQALRDLKVLTDNNLMDYSTIFTDEAKCLYQLGDYDQAYVYANKAIASDPTLPEGYVLRSLIERRQGKGNNFTTAINSLDQALVIDPKFAPALMEKARFLIEQKKYKEALPLLDKAVDAEPENAEALMLRGWLNKNHLKNAAAATNDFQKVLTLADDDVTSLRGFALHELNRDNEAAEWAEQKIKESSPIGGEAYYYAAALQAAMGNKAQGMKYLESCLANGFGGLYDIKVNAAPYVNLAPLRNEPTFNMLLNQSQLNFQER